MLSAQASGVEKVVVDAKGMSGVQILRDYREGDEPRAEKSAQRAVLPNSGPKGQGYYSSWIALPWQLLELVGSCGARLCLA